MADCKTCGQKAGIGKSVCTDCAAVAAHRESELRRAAQADLRAREAEQARLAAERKQAEEVARRERCEKYVEERIAELHGLLEQGITPYLYDEAYVASDSYYNESPNPNSWRARTETGRMGSPPDVRVLQTLGWKGWEVVGVVPVTFGSTLYNTVGGNTVHAGAFGGMVVGAHVLLRLPITHEYLNQSRKTIVDRLVQEFPG